jgi:hypothetical protein
MDVDRIDTDKFELWEPTADLPNSPYLCELRHATGELTVLLGEFESNRILQIKFSSVIGYRVVNETGRLKSFDNSSLLTYCKSTDTEFLRWFKEESEGIFDDFNLVHYVICNRDTIIDVISVPNVNVSWQ